jgi:hypothetical protein
MKWLVKQEPVRREPPGLEWRLLKRLPWIFVAGALLIGAIGLFLRHQVADGPEWKFAAAIRQADYALLGALFIFTDFLVITAIGCVIVIIMKGPHYKADAYEIPKADRVPPKPEGPS